MRVSFTRRHAGLAAAVAFAATLALPTAAMADTPQLAACDDLLVTIAPTSTTGEVTAAAVTAQALVADEPGWESVTWSVPDTTDLRDVLVLHTDGTTRSAGAQPTGTADHVLELGFCGSLGAPDSDDEVDSDHASVQIDPEPAESVEPDTDDTADADGDADASGSAGEQASATKQTGQDAAESDDAGDGAAELDSEQGAAQGTEPATDEGEDDTAGLLPSSRDAGPFFEAALAAQRPTPSVTVTAASPAAMPTVTLASATGEAATTSATSASATMSPAQAQGLGSALVWLFTGGLVGLGVLQARRRFTSQEARA